MNALESAVSSAAVQYFKQGRCELDKQRTPTAYGRFVGKAPIDFKGWYLDADGHRPPLVIECKECDKTSIPLDDKYIKEPQVEAIRRRVSIGVTTYLIVDMTSYGETYRVDGRGLVAFCDNPWRASLSLAWLRAHGMLCKTDERSNKRFVWFLDVVPHPLREVSTMAVEADRLSSPGVVELWPVKGTSKASSEFAELMKRKPHRDAPETERLQWIKEIQTVFDEGNVKRAKRKRAQRPRAWGGKKMKDWGAK